jgi:pyruvate/2-oxoglutarate dehydrogenase complex dihydrolipoamide dehydrogenase (E3) component
VKGGPQFTHISYDDYRILKANLLDGGDRTVRDRMVPYTVFMDPQLGRVGMTESEAQKERAQDSRSQDADDLGRAGPGSGRNARPDEGRSSMPKPKRY